MIDLHLHTTYSDAKITLEELLKEASNTNLEIISITDHDTIDAYYELKSIDYTKTYKGKIIPGVELTVIYDGILFHMLAYDFDINKLELWIKKTYHEKEIDLYKEFEYMYNNLKKHNIVMDEVKYNENTWPVDILFEEIKKHKENKKYFTEDEWNSIKIFYDTCTKNKDFPAYVDFSMHYPNIKEAAEMVRKADGKTFIAHIFKGNLIKPMYYLDKLTKENIIDGVEVWCSRHSEEESKILEEYCKKNNLLMSGGSDYHGIKTSTRQIGKGYNNLNIKKEIFENWDIKRCLNIDLT